MILLAVIAFWLSVFAYVPFHYRKTQYGKDVVVGFKAFWTLVLTLEETNEMGDIGNKGTQAGIVFGLLTLFAVILLTLVVAAYTIYLAC